MSRSSSWRRAEQDEDEEEDDDERTSPFRSTVSAYERLNVFGASSRTGSNSAIVDPYVSQPPRLPPLDIPFFAPVPPIISVQAPTTAGTEEGQRLFDGDPFSDARTLSVADDEDDEGIARDPRSRAKLREERSPFFGPRDYQS